MEVTESSSEISSVMKKKRFEDDGIEQQHNDLENSRAADDVPLREEGPIGSDQVRSISTLCISDEKNSEESGLSANVIGTKDVACTIVHKEDSISEASNSLIERLPTNSSRKKLLVLDINGLLADIVNQPSKQYVADATVSRRALFKRPFCDDFLRFCFENFEVAIWSSRMRKNVEIVINILMADIKSKLLFCWDASHCTTTDFGTIENRHKPVVFKELRRIWEKHDPDIPVEKGYYNETNTLLLDDSPYKALLNPPHTAIFPHSYKYTDVDDKSLGIRGDLRVYLEGLAAADNVRKYVEQNPFGQGAITETSASGNFYLEVVRKCFPTLASRLNLFDGVHLRPATEELQSERD